MLKSLLLLGCFSLSVELQAFESLEESSLSIRPVSQTQRMREPINHAKELNLFLQKCPQTKLTVQNTLPQESAALDFILNKKLLVKAGEKFNLQAPENSQFLKLEGEDEKGFPTILKESSKYKIKADKEGEALLWLIQKYILKSGEKKELLVPEGYTFTHARINHPMERFLNATGNGKLEIYDQLIPYPYNLDLFLEYFDQPYYMAHYCDDVIKTGLSPESHFLLIGNHKGYNPNDWFDNALYKKYFPNQDQLFFDSFRGVLPKKRTPPFIVSLTSWDKRIKTGWLAIESLLRQATLPDYVKLYLYEGQFPGKKLPPEYVILQRKGLDIHWVEHNLMSHKKWLYAALENPNSFILCADDDLIYQKDWFNNFYTSCKSNNFDNNTFYLSKLGFSGGQGILFDSEIIRNFVKKNKLEHVNLSPITDDNALYCLSVFFNCKIYKNKNLVEKIIDPSQKLRITDHKDSSTILPKGICIKRLCDKFQISLEPFYFMRAIKLMQKTSPSQYEQILADKLKEFGAPFPLITKEDETFILNKYFKH